jgi:hypothetical protein
VRYFFRRRIPEFTSVLVIESGSRYLVEDLLPGIISHHAGTIRRLDLVTCYAGRPKGFNEATGEIYRVTDFQGRSARKQLYRILADNRYSSPAWSVPAAIMTKWKWVLAARLPVSFRV